MTFFLEKITHFLINKPLLLNSTVWHDICGERERESCNRNFLNFFVISRPDTAVKQYPAFRVI